MVEKDGVMTLFIRQQNASAILRAGCDWSGGNNYYKWRTEEFLIDTCVRETNIICASVFK